MDSFWDDEPDDFDPFDPLSQAAAATTKGGTSEKPRALSQASTGSAAAGFVCENCGGREYELVEDGEDGQRLVCTTCYMQSTQPSQQLTQNSQMDYEDVMGLAAKTRGGGLMMQRARKSSYGPRKSTKLPLEPLNKAVPFPDLITLIMAFQSVLHECVEHLVRLVHQPYAEDDEIQRRIPNRRKIIHRTVRTLWSTYLASWSEGAEYYGSIFPTVRFSIRDCFFSIKKRRMIINTIVGRLEFERRQQQQKQDQDRTGRLKEEDDVLHAIRSASQPFSEDLDGVTDELKRTESDSSQSSASDDGLSDDDSTGASDSSAQSTSDEGSGSSGPDADLTHILSRRKKQKLHQDRLPKIERVIRMHMKYKPKTAREAALLTPPSMDLAACLLWLSVSESGLVSISTFCFWLSTGQIPLVNSLKLLPADQRQQLEPCESFFRLGWTPTPDSLRQRSTAVAVACRLKIQHAPSDRTDVGSDNNLLLGFVSPQSAPLLLAQLVGDLQLGQSVFDRSLTLLDHLAEALPRRPEHIAALVAIAVYLEPGWRKWRIVQRSRTSTSRGGASHPLLIPGNASQMRLVGNGPGFDEYFHFIEKNILSGKTHPDLLVEEYLASLKNDGTSTTRESRSEWEFNENNGHENRERGPVVRPCLDSVRMDRLDEEGATATEPGEAVGGSRPPPLDFSKMHRARCRSSRIELDPQAVMILELLAQASRLSTRSVQLAVYEMIASLPGADRREEERHSNSKTEETRKRTSRWRRALLKH